MRAREASIVDTTTGKPASLWPYLSAPRHSLLIFEDEGQQLSQWRGRGSRRPAASPACRQSSRPQRRGARALSAAWSGLVLVRPDQVVAARGVGNDFNALHAYAAQVLRARPDA